MNRYYIFLLLGCLAFSTISCIDHNTPSVEYNADDSDMVDNAVSYTTEEDVLDSIIINTLQQPGTFEYPIDSLVDCGFYESYSEDSSARLVTIRGEGTMCTGRSYIQFRNGDGFVVKKVADGPVLSKDGGMVYPALYTEIHNCRNGYQLYGTFSFSSNSEVYKDTLYVDSSIFDDFH